ncbi:hypothetical protein [Phaeocystidibacter luteus]|uniref:Uncharacterized protein n=1 Tax=Phaeocystidibacter luteus TaxID=911197 RepID=A0A6N6RLX4_9FLAO|nr:hypothetical protein [Phaeocystidibacter luteus]KAB2814575.1 hypothetical protein F8C67_02210 [Phaeocystidibacter luteus]
MSLSNLRQVQDHPETEEKLALLNQMFEGYMIGNDFQNASERSATFRLYLELTEMLNKADNPN